MGGNALKGENTFTRRYQREEYDALEQEVFAILKKTFKEFSTPRFYHKKESFGDMDLIISMEGFNGVIREYIEETFKPNEIFHNGNAYSFDYKELQIDFITVSPEDYDSNYHYLAFNDLGNFIGRITQKLGLKYGQEGLWYNHFFKDQKVGKVMISKDYPTIFEFLGFDYDKWVEGFDTLEEIFEYVIANEHFDSKMFELQHLNKINRERNAKRKSYMSFLEYIHENHSNKTFEYPEKSVSVERAIKFFPEARMVEKIREIEYKECKSLYLKSKFNGGEVMRRYGLKGKDLGDGISGFKTYIGEDKWEDYLLEFESETIYKYFEKYYNQYGHIFLSTLSK